MNGEQRKFIGRATVTVALLCVFGMIFAVFMHFLGRRERGYLPPAPQPSGVFTREQMAKADEFSRMAKAGDTNLLERIRKWAGGDIQRRIWACDIVRNASLTNELNALARDLAEACVGNDARFARLIRAAQFLEECRDWRTARDTLARAERLAKSPTEREGVSFAMLRADLAIEGVTRERLEALRRISESALMGFNRREARHLLEKYGKL